MHDTSTGEEKDMKIIGVIPARFNSSRFPGKPLCEIDGKPMIWWVYSRAKQAKRLNDVFAAIDDVRIADVCKKMGIPFVMTSEDTPNHIHRIWEVSEKIESDFYVSINGDEPLIKSENIDLLLTDLEISNAPFFKSVYRRMKDPAEVLDLANVKIVLNEKGDCLYQSRHPIPSTKGSLLFDYKKAIGIECFNKLALDFFVHSPMGTLEKIEDIDHLRFLEHGVGIKYVEIESESISVDTPNDLEKVKKLMEHGDE